MKIRPDEFETLRLLTAFLNIADAETRRVILVIAEAKASRRPIAADELRTLMREAIQR